MTDESQFAGAAALHFSPQLCIQCGFDLDHVPDRSRCPECGVEMDPRTIVIPLASRDTWLLTTLSIIGALLMLAIACVLLGLAGGSTASVVGLSVAGATVILVARAFTEWRRRAAPHRSVLVFGPDGVTQRCLGTWTSVMPYAEINGIDCRPRRRDGRRELRVHMSLGPILTLWGGGLVSLSDEAAHALHEEVRQRIERARGWR